MDLSAYTPKRKLNNKHLLTLKDYAVDDIYEVLSMALHLKAMQRKGKKHEYLRGKTLAMIFAKSSTRTRVSFEQGIKQLGGTSLFLSTNDIQLGRGETIHDTVKVLSRYNIDGIMIRTFKQNDLEQLAEFGNMPIINGLTDDFHPCQALADAMSIYEIFGRLNGIKLSYFGDGNNVAHSLMIIGAKTGMEVFICTPIGYEPSADVTEYCKKFGNVTVTNDVALASKDCDVFYTDVFFSMGQEKTDEKINALMPYQINEPMLTANPNAIFMHCLPAHRGEEVTAGVIDGSQSIVFEQAENRLHAQKAVMALLMK